MTVYTVDKMRFINALNAERRNLWLIMSNSNKQPEFTGTYGECHTWVYQQSDPENYYIQLVNGNIYNVYRF